MTRPYFLIGTRGDFIPRFEEDRRRQVCLYYIYKLYNLYLVRCITVYIYIYTYNIYIYIYRIKQCNVGVGLMFHQSVSLSSWASGKCLSSSFTSTPHRRLSNSAL